MKRSLFYLVVIGLILFGGFIGYLSIPSENELTMMYLERGDFDLAYERLKEMAGDEGEAVGALMPMAMINLSRGDIPKALNVFERAVKRDPGSLNIRRGMTNLYKNCDHIREYVKSLAIQYKMHPDKAVAHELSTWYSALGRSEEEYEILQELLKYSSLDEREELRLGFLIGLHGDSELLKKTLAYITKKKGIDAEVLLYYTGLSLNFGFVKKADELAYAYYKKAPTADTLVSLAWTFIGEKVEFPLKKYIALIPEKSRSDPKLLALQYDLLVNKRKMEEAYRYLVFLYRENLLPAKLELPLLEQAIEYEKETAFLEELFSTISLERASSDKIASLVEKGLNAPQKGLHELVKKKLSSSFLEKHPPIAIAFAIAEGENRRAGELLKGAELSDEEEFFLTRILLQQGKKNEAIELVKKVGNIEQMGEGELFQYSTILASLGLEEFGREMLGEIRDKLPKEKFRNAMAPLDAARGKESAVLKWAEKKKGITDYEIKDLISIADQKRHPLLNLELSRLLLQKFPSEKNKPLLAIALAKAGELDSATAMIDELAAGERELYDEKLLILGLAAKEEEEREAFENFFKQVKREKSIGRKELLSVAYQLFDEGAKGSAGAIFFTLAKKSPFKSDEVQGLLASWGKNLGKKEVDYIKMRALQAPKEERGEWLKQLLYGDKGKELLSFLPRAFGKEEVRGDRELALITLDAAMQTGEKEGMADLLYPLAAEEELNSDALEKYAAYATYFGAGELAASLLIKLYEKKPEEGKLLLDIANAYISVGNYPGAKHFLQMAICFDRQNPGYAKKLSAEKGEESGFSYLIYFYWAEMLIFEERHEAADDYLLASLQRIHALEEKKASDLAVEAAINLRLGNRIRAVALYNRSIQMEPKSRYRVFEKSALLLDLQCFLAVKYLLFKSPFAREIEGAGCSDAEAWSALQLARIQYLKSVYRLERAQEICNALLKRSPDKLSTLAAASDLANVKGKRQLALHYIERALRQQPENCPLKKFKRELLKPYLRNAIWGRESKVTINAGVEEIYRLFLAAPLGRRDLRSDLLVEIDGFDLEAIVDGKTGKTVALKEVRSRISAGLLHPFPSGLELQARLYYSNPNAGFEALGNYRDSWGAWDLNICYNKPDWEFLQTLVDRGSSNKFSLTRTLQWVPKNIMQLRYLCNQLNLQQIKNAAAYQLIDFHMATELNNPYHRLSKQLFGSDALLNWDILYEYQKPLHSKTVENIFANSYTPIAIEEKSSLRSAIAFQKIIRYNWTIRGHYGYLLDLKAKKWSSYYGGGIDFRMPRKIRFNLLYEYLPAGGSSTSNGATKRIYVELGGDL